MITDFLKHTLRNEAGSEGDAGGGSPAPAPAPAPAPVPTPEPAPAPAPEPPTDKPKAPDFESTGDPTTDYVLGYLGEQGIDFESPAFLAALEGDFAQLEIELLKKGAPGADKVLALAQRAHEAHTETVEKANAALAEELQGIAGGAEEWEAVVGWAKETATPEEKEAINGLLEQGGLAARIAGTYLVNSYRGADGTSFEGKPAAEASSASPAGSTPGPLTRVQFAQEAEKLYRQHGNEYQNTPQYAQLVSRRRG